MNPPHILDAIAERLATDAIRGAAAPGEALAAACQAVEAWREKAAANPDEVETDRALLNSLARLGHLQAATGDRDAESTLRETLDRRRRAGSTPAEIAHDLSMLGAVQMITDGDAALATLAESVELHAGLAEQDPKRWGGSLSRGLLCLAALLADRGRFAESRATTLDLFEAIEGPDVIDVDRADFVQTVSDLVSRIAPTTENASDAQTLRTRLAALQSTLSRR